MILLHVVEFDGFLMSFNKLINCFITCVIVIGISETVSGKNEEKLNQLLDTIYGCAKHIDAHEDNNPVLSLDDGGDQNRRSLQNVFALFEIELILILKRIYNDNITEITTNLTDDQVDNNGYVKITFSETRLSKEMCFYIPQCLDFIYTNSPSSSLLYTLGKLHRMICQSFYDVITKLCSILNRSIYTYYCTDTRSYKMHRIITYFDTIFNNYKVVYKQDFNVKEFIQSVQGIINTIDKTEMIKNNHELSKQLTIKYIFQPVTQHDYSYQDVQINNINLDFLLEFQDEVNNHLNVINNIYKNSMGLQSCVSKNEMFNFQYKENSTIQTVSRLLLYTLKRLRIFFLTNLTQFITQLPFDDINGVIDINELRVWISSMFDGICKRVPLLFIYIRLSSFEDTILYSYYSVFCDDNLNFVLNRCPSIGISTSSTSLLNVFCVIKSIKFKLLRNFYLTNTIDEISDITIDDHCSEVFIGYISKIYNVLDKYNQKETIHVWTTFEWLSGKTFLTEQYPNNDINNLKLMEIKVNKDVMLLSEAYHLVLQLNLNLNAMLNFYNLFLLHVDRQLAVYVCRQVLIISSYINEYFVRSSVLQNISKSLNWYHQVRQIFVEYFSVPFNNHGPSESMKSLINDIENLHLDTKSYRQLIPEDIFNDSLTWVKRQLSEKTITGLNNLVLKNCEIAFNFLMDLQSISQQSLSSSQIDYQNKCVDNHQQYCIESVQNMFTVKSKTRFVKNCLVKESQ